MNRINARRSKEGRCAGAQDPHTRQAHWQAKRHTKRQARATSTEKVVLQKKKHNARELGVLPPTDLRPEQHDAATRHETTHKLIKRWTKLSINTFRVTATFYLESCDCHSEPSKFRHCVQTVANKTISTS
jgi:hypothetical protein